MIRVRNVDNKYNGSFLAQYFSDRFRKSYGACTGDEKVRGSIYNLFKFGFGTTTVHSALALEPIIVFARLAAGQIWAFSARAHREAPLPSRAVRRVAPAATASGTKPW